MFPGQWTTARWWWRVWAARLCGAILEGHTAVHRQHSQRYLPVVGASTFWPQIWQVAQGNWCTTCQNMVSTANLPAVFLSWEAFTFGEMENKLCMCETYPSALTGTASTARPACPWKCVFPTRSSWSTTSSTPWSTGHPRLRRSATCSAPSRPPSSSRRHSWTGWRWACRCAGRATTCWTCSSTGRTLTISTWTTTSTWSQLRHSPQRFASAFIPCPPNRDGCP